LEGWKIGRMEDWKNGRMEGWKDGKTRLKALMTFIDLEGCGPSQPRYVTRALPAGG